MKFHDYRALTPWLQKNVPGFVPSEERTIRWMNMEREWGDLKRPYYNIWPSMLDPFHSVDVESIPREILRLPLPVICIRFPQSYSRLHSVMVSSDGKTLSLLVDQGDNGTLGVPVVTVAKVDISKQGLPSLEVFRKEVDYKSQAHPEVAGPADERIADSFAAFVIVAALCLVARDPELVVQKLLKNAPDTPEQRERAVRRGCHEFDVGRNVVAAPGYRKPHFAIRWMGHGDKKEPRLRPVKGCIVMRSVVEEVPTGYLDDEVSE